MSEERQIGDRVSGDKAGRDKVQGNAYHYYESPELAAINVLIQRTEDVETALSELKTLVESYHKVNMKLYQDLGIATYELRRTVERLRWQVPVLMLITIVLIEVLARWRW